MDSFVQGILQPGGNNHSHCGFSLWRHFPPVASGTVVCKNNTTVLGWSGRAGAQQKKKKEKHIRILGDHNFTMAPSADNYAKQRPHNMNVT